ncbi:TadE/TadG family type IV pilus assembly protein [Kitasatospora sp. GP82]|uniref:TadE/TadG family type IV pilus assembly protein n=1 Tax=Kitasatospora sp. GP82 TaxID=3035089 RepID=UPI002475A5A7|nr:TadE/TadG family type IV pilus assembly protein [Kitasatospora sp. GP82]MDH6130508.1 Flp pilus assembly protein TadG [Kitasatospora sp. GP82]
MGRRADRGSLSLETAILAPVLLTALLVAIAAGRIHIADNTVDAAARNAARAASLERDGSTARSEGTRIAQQTLQEQGLRCSSLTVDVPTGGFTAALGAPANVTVTVTCQLCLSDLLIPGFPGSKAITATFTSPIDPYRGRLTTS